jgi:hypothetical protein
MNPKANRHILHLPLILVKIIKSNNFMYVHGIHAYLVLLLIELDQSFQTNGLNFIVISFVIYTTNEKPMFL